MIAHSPALAVSCMQTVKDQFTALELPDRDREVVILTVATLAECEYEWIQHVELSEAVGISSTARQSIRSKDFGADTLTARDRIIITFVQEIVDTPRVHDEVFAEVRQLFTPREIVELIFTIGYWGLVARLLETLEVDFDDMVGKVNVAAPTRD